MAFLRLGFREIVCPLTELSNSTRMIQAEHMFCLLMQMSLLMPNGQADRQKRSDSCASAAYGDDTKILCFVNVHHGHLYLKRES